MYSEVNEILDGTASEEILNKYAPVMESLMSAKELADILKANSAARGTMELDSGESKFILDENGICIDIMPRVSGEAEQLIVLKNGHDFHNEDDGDGEHCGGEILARP